jgi:hypothetical protein
MKSDTVSPKQRFISGLFLMAWGGLMILEGLQITQFGKPADGIPYWLISIVGATLSAAGIAILIKDESSRWKDLLAFIITALLGTVGGWISLFSSESSIGGNFSFLSPLLNLPLGRITFGVGAIICYLIALYALKLFYQKTLNQRG